MKINEIMHKLRVGMIRESPNLNKCDIYFEETRNIDNSHVLMPLVALRTNPCSWLKAGGGCVMCGYQLAASLGKEPTEQDLINQTKYAIKRLPAQIYPLITFNAAGSFLDAAEISDELRPKLLQMLRNAGYREFNFECRPEFLLNEKRVSQLKEYFDVVSVGIGLESSDDFIRNECLNKGTQIDTYLKAAKVLRKYNISYDAYIQLGKPFLTAKEDIEDAIKTAKFAFEHGFTRVFLMLCNIQPSTLTHFLWKRGKFSPPTLWRAVEVINRLPAIHRYRAYIKGFNRAVPTPLELPKNCPKCTSQVADKLIHWNLTGDYKHIEEMPNCDCLKEFQRILTEKPKKDLKTRHKETIKYIEDELAKSEASSLTFFSSA